MGAEIFDWDEANIRHIAAHNVTPREAEQVLLNDPADGGSHNVDGEERDVDIGITDAMRVLVVITTDRGELIRVVTAYEASAAFRDLDFRQKGQRP